MNIRYCSECGAEIIFLYETPSKAYRISEGSLIRDDNNISDNPELIAICSDNMEHELEVDQEFNSWFDEINENFIRNALYDI